MTGTDPAREAAKRAWDGPITGDPWDDMLRTAREALKPIRDLHKPVPNPGGCCNPECICHKPAIVCSCQADREDKPPVAWRDCPTARLIYSTEELEYPQ